MHMEDENVSVSLQMAAAQLPSRTSAALVSQP